MKILVKNLIKNFDIKILNPKDSVLTKTLSAQPVTRVGLELSGAIKKSKSYDEAVIGWGTKEGRFLETLSDKKMVEHLKTIIDDKTPLIILSSGFKSERALKELITVANEHKVPVSFSNGHLGDIMSKLTENLLHLTAEKNPIHGSLIVINSVGVLIKGPSGIGKSEAQLELIQKGHIFVADDSVETYVLGGHLHGNSSPITKDLLEVRGIGLMNVPFIYGAKSVVDSHKISLVIDLVPHLEQHNLDRIGDKGMKEAVGGISLPKMQIPTGEGRSVSSLIEAAVNVYIAKNQGMDPMRLIKERTEESYND